MKLGGVGGADEIVGCVPPLGGPDSAGTGIPSVVPDGGPVGGPVGNLPFFLLASKPPPVLGALAALPGLAK